MTAPRLLIDGDQFLYKACAAHEEEVRWDDQNHVLVCNENKAWDTFTGMIDRIRDRFETEESVLCFSGDSAKNFRREVSADYKAGRPRKPLCYAELREWCDKYYSVMAYDCLEADDVMGLLATSPTGKKFPNIIVSQDKDMKTVPATIWDGKDLINVSEVEADYNFFMQTLTGDQTDGYKGCPGVGPVKAAKILLKSPTWARVSAEYISAGLSAEEALKQARLARILRWSDWDNVNKKPKLWLPPTP